MGSVVANLLPLILGSAIVPVWIIMVILILGGTGGRAKAIAFVAGLTLVRLIQGTVFGLVFNNTDTSSGENDSRTITSVLLLVVAVLMLVTAARQFLAGDDPDAPPPKWMKLLDSLTPLKAFAMGAGLILIAAKHWVFMFGALSTIREGDLSRTESIVAFLFFIIGAELLLILPILYAVVSPKSSTATLGAVSGWLEAHNRPIVIAVSLDLRVVLPLEVVERIALNGSQTKTFARKS